MAETFRAEHPALFAAPEGERIRCRLCAHYCLIGDGQRGRCGVRIHRDGALYTLVYGRVIAEHLDPIEKKPLYHFYPGSRSMSIAAPGCNMRCLWCQNWEISQFAPPEAATWGEPASPDGMVDRARRAGCKSISYTYTEPTIFFEYALDIARRADEAGIANVFVTNGYMTHEALRTIAPVLGAASVDLKAFSEPIHERTTGARLRPVLETLRRMKRLGIWVEVTTLIVPGVNDDHEQLRGLASFLANELGHETPWHVSRFFPAYRMTDVQPTPVETIIQATEIGQEAGLQYVYTGNVGGSESTACPACGELLIRRAGPGRVESFVTASMTCPACDEVIAGIGMGHQEDGGEG